MPNPAWLSYWDFFTLTLIAWLVTYLIHSSAFFGMVWLTTSLKRCNNTLKDLLWKMSLVGGLITATAQVIGGVSPFAGQWVLTPDQLVTALNQTPSMEGAPAVPETLLTRSSRSTQALFDLPMLEPPLIDMGNSPGPFTLTPTSLSGPTPNSRWATLLLLFWASGVAIMLVRLLSGHQQLQSELAERERMTFGPLRGMLDDLCAAIGARRHIRLSVSTLISSPLAFGASEICVPTLALNKLNRAQQRSLLAHELAHLIRRDTFWLVLAAILESIFFFQPLNRLARQRMQMVTEYLCDDWAVLQTGSALSLAECLAEVASWIVAKPDHSFAIGITSGAAPLTLRVQRLLDHENSPTLETWRHWWLLIVVGILFFISAAAPGLSTQWPSQMDVLRTSEVNEIPVQIARDTLPSQAAQSTGFAELRRVQQWFKAWLDMGYEVMPKYFAKSA